MKRATYIKVGAGHYRHLPTGYEVKQGAARGGSWRVYDGGGHIAFQGSFAGAKAWISEAGT